MDGQAGDMGDGRNWRAWSGGWREGRPPSGWWQAKDGRWYPGAVERRDGRPSWRGSAAEQSGALPDGDAAVLVVDPPPPTEPGAHAGSQPGLLGRRLRSLRVSSSDAGTARHLASGSRASVTTAVAPDRRAAVTSAVVLDQRAAATIAAAPGGGAAAAIPVELDRSAAVTTAVARDRGAAMATTVAAGRGVAATTVAPADRRADVTSAVAPDPRAVTTTDVAAGHPQSLPEIGLRCHGPGPLPAALTGRAGRRHSTTVGRRFEDLSPAVRVGLALAVAVVATGLIQWRTVGREPNPSAKAGAEQPTAAVPAPEAAPPGPSVPPAAPSLPPPAPGAVPGLTDATDAGAGALPSALPPAPADAGTMAGPADAGGGTGDGATFGAVVPMAEETLAPTASTAQSPAPGCTSPDAVTGAAFPRSDGDRGPTSCP